MSKPSNIIIIGGSAGSFSIIMELLPVLPQKFHTPIVIVLHRLRNVSSEMDQLFSKVSNAQIIQEPEDKEPILPGKIYLAPQNYHLLIEPDGVFSLDYSEPINYSRPSIDLTFQSAAAVYRNQCTGILLSGANKDGAEGIKQILNHGGNAIIQDPADAAYKAMPQAAIAINSNALVINTQSLIQIIKNTLVK
jgi:two-component system, chemotaxis family, protein-glutamate methylesterase/glutaminase